MASEESRKRLTARASVMEAKLFKTSKFEYVQTFMGRVQSSIAEGSLDEDAMGALQKGKNHQSPQQVLWEGLDLEMEDEADGEFWQDQSSEFSQFDRRLKAAEKRLDFHDQLHAEAEKEKRIGHLSIRRKGPMDTPTFHSEVKKFQAAVDQSKDIRKLVSRQVVMRDEVLVEAWNSNTKGELKSALIHLVREKKFKLLVLNCIGESAKHLGRPARVFHSFLYQMAEADSVNLGRLQRIRHSFQGFDDAEDDVVIARGSVERRGDDSECMAILITESIPFTKGAAKGSDLLPLFKDSMHNTVVLPFEIETKIVDGSLLTHGISAVLRRRLAKNILDIQPVSERIILVKLRCPGRPLAFVGLYAPAADASRESTDAFWSFVQQTYKPVKHSCITYFFGDLNARVQINSGGDEANHRIVQPAREAPTSSPKEGARGARARSVRRRRTLRPTATGVHGDGAGYRASSCEQEAAACQRLIEAQKLKLASLFCPAQTRSRMAAGARFLASATLLLLAAAQVNIFGCEFEAACADDGGLSCADGLSCYQLLTSSIDGILRPESTDPESVLPPGKTVCGVSAAAVIKSCPACDACVLPEPVLRSLRDGLDEAALVGPAGALRVATLAACASALMVAAVAAARRWGGAAPARAGRAPGAEAPQERVLLADGLEAAVTAS
ncbi:unnamed protein product [Prorocentrum cordatum]|uniref:Uncharacterized protein n=1 Tax=Prorocentrum cordatum TaxID=2364126 RepID=A0ABN9XPW9_9DINO|nr:unnamed protein product [Polarella glacialis]